MSDRPLGRREKLLLDKEAFIETKFPGVEIFAISSDVTKKSAVDAAFSQFAGSGEIHVLIHATAVIGPKEIIADVDGEEYLGAIQTNLAGSLWVAQAFLRHAAPDVVVVAMNPWGAHLSLNDAFASYCVTKIAVYRLWDIVAIANPNLSIFYTQPGVILSDRDEPERGRRRKF